MIIKYDVWEDNLFGGNFCKNVIQIILDDRSELFSMNEHYISADISYEEILFLRLVKYVPTVSCSETTRTFPFLFHGSENNRSRVNSVLLYAVCSLLFSPTLIFRISAHSCAIDRRWSNQCTETIDVSPITTDFSFVLDKLLQ